MTALTTHSVRYIAIYRAGEHKCPDFATRIEALGALQHYDIRGVRVDRLGIGVCDIERDVAHNIVGEGNLQAVEAVAIEVATLGHGDLHGVHLVAHDGVKLHAVGCRECRCRSWLSNHNVVLTIISTRLHRRHRVSNLRAINRIGLGVTQEVCVVALRHLTDV